MIRRLLDEGDAGGEQPQGDNPQEPAAAPPVADDGTPAWMQGLSLELRANKMLRRFSTVDALAKSAINKDSELRSRPAKGAIVVPDDSSTDEQRSRYREAMDIPDAPEGYEIDLQGGSDPARPEYMPQKARAAAAEEVRKVAHEMALSRGQAKQLVKFLGEASQRSATERQDLIARTASEQEAAIQKEWGADAESQLAKINKVYPAVGDSLTGELRELLTQQEFPGGLGVNATMRKLLVKIGDLVSDDSVVPGTLGAGGAAPQRNFQMPYSEDGKPGSLI